MHIVYKKSFKKTFSKLPISTQIKCIERVSLLVDNPSNPILRVHHLKGVLSGVSSFNVTSDIRVHYIIKDTHYILLKIGTHSELY